MHKNVITLALVLLPVVAFASPRSEAPAGETIVLHGAVTLTDGKATVWPNPWGVGHFSG